MLHLTGSRQSTSRTRDAHPDSNLPYIRISRRTLLAGMLALPIAIACGDSDEEATSTPAATTVALTPKKLTFMAGFKAQANLPFVGVYVAQEKGFFREQALDVDIRHAQQGEHLQLTLANEVQVSTANGASILKRQAQNLDILSIALIGQRPETGFAVLADSGIATVKDWSGKTFGYKGSVPAEFPAIAKANGLDPKTVKQVSVGFDPRVLSERTVDILPVFFSNEPDTLNAIGVKTKVFDPVDYGIESLGLTYFTSRDYFSKEPDTLARFLKAVLKGILDADANRDAAVDIVLKYGPQEDRAHQKFMLDTELTRAKTSQTATNGIGWQTKEQWQRAHDTLLEFGGIDKAVDVTKAFDDTLLKRIYKDGKLV